MCSYKCSTFGKNFKNTTTFYEHTTVTCQADKTWSLAAFPDTCECKLWVCKATYDVLTIGSHCVNPPDPPAESKMLLMWNPDFPPAHNESVLYKCNAGPTYNRFVSDYSKYNYTLTCLPDNQFSAPEWPVCADCKLNI